MFENHKKHFDEKLAFLETEKESNMEFLAQFISY